jgi:asparagine synthase (glutamine-hydrolysing)
VSGIALAIGRNGRLPDLDAVRAMANAGSHRARAGREEEAIASAAAIALRQFEAPRNGDASIATDEGGTVLAIVDARIDNREELAAELGLGEASEVSNAGLVLAGYQRWGDRIADRLYGDYALAVWDSLAGELVAARDPFGLRALSFRVEPERILVATETRQVLAAPGVPPNVHLESVAAMVAGTDIPASWSFFEGVRRVMPGRVLRTTATGSRSRPTWHPARIAERRGATTEELVEELRALLERSVRDRLAPAERPGLLLSGGIDSTSIAATAGRLHARGEAPLLRTFSFQYDELPACDERAISDVVASEAGLPATHVPVDTAWPLASYPNPTSEPDTPHLLRSYVAMGVAREAMAAEGIDVVLSGHRGDSLFGFGVLDYLGLMLSEGPLALWRQVDEHHRASGESRRRILEHAVLRRLPTTLWPRYRAPGLRRYARRLRRGPRSTDLPRWAVAGRLQALGVERAREAAQPRSRLRGEARRMRHEELSAPVQTRNAEAMERVFARAGMQYGDPWSDRRIAEFILSIPAHVLSPAGREKWLLREAMRGILPEPARDGSFSANPGPSYERGMFERGVEAGRALLATPRTEELGLIDGGEARAVYERMIVEGPYDYRAWGALWRLMAVEMFLAQQAG